MLLNTGTQIPFHFTSTGFGVGGALSMAGFIGDNMIQGWKPFLDFKQVILSKLYVGANYINFPQQPNTYFISISHQRWGPGIPFRRLLSLSNIHTPTGTLGSRWPIDVTERGPGCLPLLGSTRLGTMGLPRQPHCQ